MLLWQFRSPVGGFRGAAGDARGGTHIAQALHGLLNDAVELHGRIARSVGCEHLLRTNGQPHLYPHEAAMAADAGAWSSRLLKPLGLKVPLQTQRGYHLQYAQLRDTLSRVVVLADRRVFINPMQEGLHIGGTVEIDSIEHPPRPAGVLSSGLLMAGTCFALVEAWRSSTVAGLQCLVCYRGSDVAPARGAGARPGAFRP